MRVTHNTLFVTIREQDKNLKDARKGLSHNTTLNTLMLWILRHELDVKSRSFPRNPTLGNLKLSVTAWYRFFGWVGNGTLVEKFRIIIGISRRDDWLHITNKLITYVWLFFIILLHLPQRAVDCCNTGRLQHFVDMAMKTPLTVLYDLTVAKVNVTWSSKGRVLTR